MSLLSIPNPHLRSKTFSDAVKDDIRLRSAGEESEEEDLAEIAKWIDGESYPQAIPTDDEGHPVIRPPVAKSFGRARPRSSGKLRSCYVRDSWKFPPSENIANSEAMKELFEQLRQGYLSTAAAGGISNPSEGSGRMILATDHVTLRTSWRNARRKEGQILDCFVEDSVKSLAPDRPWKALIWSNDGQDTYAVEISNSFDGISWSEAYTPVPLLAPSMKRSTFSKATAEIEESLAKGHPLTPNVSDEAK